MIEYFCGSISRLQCTPRTAALQWQSVVMSRRERGSWRVTIAVIGGIRAALERDPRWANWCVRIARFLLAP